MMVLGITINKPAYSTFRMSLYGEEPAYIYDCSNKLVQSLLNVFLGTKITEIC